MGLVNVRIQGEAEAALAELTADGTTVSDAVRRALLESAQLRRRERMRADALRAMNDSDDRAAMRQVMNEWADVSAW
ncbi:hypothetical protein [Piscicoccus intestinalis]|uniref:hypothetical protein n=1 Tax=Piscicoccus intestinalis TaxID=746033 RepID=UPI000837D64C|nr:hypothetical protein [Piscicoccus intestinalis]